MLVAVSKRLTKRLCTGLTLKEFRCRCNHESCRSTFYNTRLVEAYKKFRKLVGVPLNINSGFRCILHNFNEKGSALSRHTTGEAIDIRLDTLQHLSREEIEFALKKAGFTFILFYKTFVHADVRIK